MNINCLSSSPVNFTGIYVNDLGMTRTVQDRVNAFVAPLDYEKSIDELDKMGVDVLITSVDNQNGQGAKIIFADTDNRAYKVSGAFSINTGTLYPFNCSDDIADYENNLIVTSILKTAKNILNGTITEKSIKPSSVVVREFPMRDSILDRQDYPDKHGLTYDEEESLMSEEYERLSNKYSIDTYV